MRQLPGPWTFFIQSSEQVAFEQPEGQVGEPFVVERHSTQQDGLLLLPGRRVYADGSEAEVETRRRLAWGLTQEEALAHARACRR